MNHLLNKIFILTFIFFLLNVKVYAKNNNLSLIKNSAHKLNLAFDPTWLKLLKYDKKINKKYVSSILSKNFFNSKFGRFDPKAELNATLNAFFDFTSSGDNHAQCRFPARLVWFIDKLDINQKSLPLVNCESYKNWSFNGKIKSISFILASGYLGNPASYYGHTTLKLNGSQRTDLEDKTVNYGARVPDKDGVITYIFKGLFGGYKGTYSNVDYYFAANNYTEIENRDLWEYELNFTDKEVQFILKHMWEILGKEYTYYFLSQNCAYRMAKLIDVVKGVDFKFKHKPFVIPQDITQELNNTTIDGRPLIKNITFTPSRQTKFNQGYVKLNKKQKKS